MSNRKRLPLVLIFVNAIIEGEGGKVLLGKQPDTETKPYPGKWDIPGGKIEPKKDPSVLVALSREIQEETGLTIVSAEFLAVFEHWGNNIRPECKFPDISGLGVCYLVEASGDVRPSELEEMGWYELDTALSMELTPWCRYFLEKYKEIIE